MQRHISSVLVCGMVAAIGFGAAQPAMAQSTTSTTSVTSSKRIPVRKDGRTTTESSGSVSAASRDSAMRADSMAAAERARMDAERARQDSIAAVERARQDSIAAVERARADSVARVERARMDSIARVDSIARADSLARAARLLNGRWGGATFGLGAGASMPMSDLKDAYKTGFNVTGMLGYHPVSWPVGVRFDVGYDRWRGKDIGGVSVDDANVWSGLANLTLKVPNLMGFSPYVVGGGGIYRLSSGGSSSSSVNKGGYNLGGGINFGWGLTQMFLESRYHSVSTEGTKSKFVPIILGITFR